MYYILAQAVGFVAMAICISSFACKRSSLILFLQAIGNGLFILHFLMLGAYSGCINVAVMVSSNIVLLFYMKDKAWASWPGWRWVFCVLSVAVCAATWKDLFSVLPCFSTISFILTNWTRRETVIRVGKLTVVAPGWIIYNAHVHSYSGVLSESIGMCSALFSILYYRWLTKSHPSPPDTPELSEVILEERVADSSGQPVNQQGGASRNDGDI